MTELTPAAGTPPRVCEYCGNPMPEGKRSHARWCSTRCAGADRRARMGIRAGVHGWAGPPTPEAGARFGRLVVVGPEVRVPDGATGKTRRGIVCRCECGVEKPVNLARLLGGDTRSCGCLARETSARIARSPARIAAAGAAHCTHGLRAHPLYNTWRMMVARCENPSATGYKNYGGRGIRVCPEWHDVRNFIEWIEANLGPRPSGMTLDRIDVNGNYEPGNVRWATASEQARNQRRRVGEPGQAAPRVRAREVPEAPAEVVTAVNGRRPGETREKVTA